MREAGCEKRARKLKNVGERESEGKDQDSLSQTRSASTTTFLSLSHPVSFKSIALSTFSLLYSSFSPFTKRKMEKRNSKRAVNVVGEGEDETFIMKEMFRNWFESVSNFNTKTGTGSDASFISIHTNFHSSLF